MEVEQTTVQRTNNQPTGTPITIPQILDINPYDDYDDDSDPDVANERWLNRLWAAQDLYMGRETQTATEKTETICDNESEPITIDSSSCSESGESSDEYEFVAELYDTNKSSKQVRFSDDVKEQTFIFDDECRVRMFIDDEENPDSKYVNRKELTLNPIKQKQNTLTPQKFKVLKDKYFKDACDKSLPGLKRLWSLKKLKLLVDRREKVLCTNKGKPYNEEDDSLDVSEMEENIKKSMREQEQVKKEDKEGKEKKEERKKNMRRQKRR